MTEIKPSTLARRERQAPLICGLVTLLLMGAGAEAAEEPLDCLIEPHRLVDVSSSEIGVLGAVHVDKADVIRAGDKLAELRMDVEQAALKLSRARATATGELELLKRSLEFNSRNRTRSDELYTRKVISFQTMDEARTEQELSRLRLKQATEKSLTAKLEAERDRLSLERRIIRAPISGVVVERFKSEGEYVEGDPIVQLAQIDPLRVELVVPIAWFGKIRVGMNATVVPELPDSAPQVATVSRVDPVIDAATATFGVRLALPNPEHRIPPGLKCTLSLGKLESADRVARRTPPRAALEPQSDPRIVPRFLANVPCCDKPSPGRGAGLTMSAEALSSREEGGHH